MKYTGLENSFMPTLASHLISRRLPIIDPSNGNILYILNQKPLLRFLFYYVPNLQSFDHLAVSVLDAGVGTYNNVEVRYAYRMTMVKNSFR